MYIDTAIKHCSETCELQYSKHALYSTARGDSMGRHLGIPQGVCQRQTPLHQPHRHYHTSRITKEQPPRSLLH